MAGDEALVAGHEGEQVLVEGAEPQSIIDHVGVFLRHQRLESLRLLAQAQRLQLAMGLVQDHRRRGLVHLARLDADQPILDVIDPADAVLAAELVELFDQRHAVQSFGRSRPTGLPCSNSIST